MEMEGRGAIIYLYYIFDIRVYMYSIVYRMMGGTCACAFCSAARSCCSSTRLTTTSTP